LRGGDDRAARDTGTGNVRTGRRSFVGTYHDGNNSRIDEGEVSTLLDNANVATYGQQIEHERKQFFRGLGKSINRGDDESASDAGLIKEQFTSKG
jgi:hypothetical protein